MVKEIRVNGTKIEFEDDELAATRTLKELSDGAYGTGSLKSKIITATRDMAAASGNVAYTGVGFTPTAIFALASIAGGFVFAVGMVDSTKTGSNVTQYTANVLTRTNNLLTIDTSGSPTSQTADVYTFNADGFTLTWIKTGLPTGTALLSFLCFR